MVTEIGLLLGGYKKYVAWPCSMGLIRRTSNNQTICEKDCRYFELEKIKILGFKIFLSENDG